LCFLPGRPGFFVFFLIIFLIALSALVKNISALPLNFSDKTKKQRGNADNYNN